MPEVQKTRALTCVHARDAGMAAGPGQPGMPGMPPRTGVQPPPPMMMVMAAAMAMAKAKGRSLPLQRAMLPPLSFALVPRACKAQPCFCVDHPKKAMQAFSAASRLLASKGA